MRFCQAFMQELFRHIGANIDVPAGDIGVGPREIGYLFGEYKKLTRSFEGVLTGKSLAWGGSHIRPEATGYGVVFFAREAIACMTKNGNLKGKKCLISGSGNVALHTASQLISQGATVLTMSDSEGVIVEPDGFTKEQLDKIFEIKQVQRERIKKYQETSKTAKYLPNTKVWKEEISCDYAFPCATQNEIDESDAKNLVSKCNCTAIFEGANMPSTSEAIRHFKDNGILFGPAKACNAGGVAVSGLEMSQNAMKLIWSKEEVLEKLESIMKEIFHKCYDTSKEYGKEGDLQFGANIAGFLKVACAIKEEGVV